MKFWGPGNWRGAQGYSRTRVSIHDVLSWSLPSPSTSPSLTFLLKISRGLNPRSTAAGRPWGFGGRRPRSSACSGHPSWTANDGTPALPLSRGDESGRGLLRVGRWGEQAGQARLIARHSGRLSPTPASPKSPVSSSFPQKGGQGSLGAREASPLKSGGPGKSWAPLGRIGLSCTPDGRPQASSTACPGTCLSAALRPVGPHRRGWVLAAGVWATPRELLGGSRNQGAANLIQEHPWHPRQLTFSGPRVPVPPLGPPDPCSARKIESLGGGMMGRGLNG